jgi:hypothetical protein
MIDTPSFILTIREMAFYAYTYIDETDTRSLYSKLYKTAILYLRKCQKDKIPYADRLASFYWKILSSLRPSTDNIGIALDEEKSRLYYNVLEIALEVS